MKKIAVVEDNPDNRLLLQVILEGQFDIVGEADNVVDAINLIRERKPDLVILDIRIREGSGAEVLKQVRKTNPEIVYGIFAALIIANGIMLVMGYYGVRVFATTE